MNLLNSDQLVSTFYFLFIFVLFINLRSSTSAVPGNETDHSALLSFKAVVTSDPLRSLDSWNQSSHFCQWVGIICGGKHGRVIEINLPSKQLTGPLSPFIGNLSFLRVFNINDNSFTGEIPLEIARLSKLRVLSMANNSFTGEILSNISVCFNLETIDFGGNRLIGTIPSEFQSLGKLKFLYLFKNNLTGEIPDFLGNFSALEEISLTYNFFQGNIPNTLGRLTNLKRLLFGVNYLSGTMPLSFFNMSNLEILDLTFNEIEGAFPSNLALNIPSLQYLIIASNRFTGFIPESIANVSQLISLDLGINGFTGHVPNLNGLQRLEKLFLDDNSLGNGDEGDLNFFSSLSNTTSLKELYFQQNNLGGIFPTSIGNLSELMYLAMQGNPIYGNIPSNIRDLVKLVGLGMNDCKFSGSIPSSIANLQELQILSLRGNNFSGEIPPSLGNLTKLIELDLGNNNLEGSIPSTLAKCIDLSHLDLSQNNLTGHIPSGLLSLPSLTDLIDLSDNRLSGPLILDEQVSRSLKQFSASNNFLSGEIPSNIGDYQGLSYLSLAGNLFGGGIPPSVSSLRGIEVLNLSRNNLTGKIPEYLRTFPFLRSLNLSFNDFEGTVPVGGVFSSASNFSVNGNSNVCGGVQELNLPTCATEPGASKKTRLLSRSQKYIIATCIGVPALILTCLVIFLYKRRHAKPVPKSESLVRDTFPQMSYKDLHRATDGFSSTNLCGSGKFSSVYKGVLDQNETVVAVKVLKLDVTGAAKSFTAECEALRTIRHRNLVKILTSCSSIDFQGNAFKAMVYAFMANGSLEEWLHKTSRSLTLLERLNITIDVASALDYLHNHLHTSMVHCDVKPSNVLLDIDLVAHLGDFGLLKFLQEAASATSNTSSLGVKGTVGYAPPEYGMGSEISTYGDAYSFGILILEIFSGKRPTDEMFNDGLNLHNFVKMAIPNGIMKISDPRLMPNEEELQQTDGDIETQNNPTYENGSDCLVSLFKIGVFCSVEPPKERMDIRDAIHGLHLIKKTLLESRIKNPEKGSL